MSLFQKLGGWLNDLTGVTTSAKQQQNAQMSLQKDAQEFSKWQMANAHQTEVQDLQKAGLNPVLSTGGNGASAGVTEGSASAGISSGADILGMLLNSAKTISEIDKQSAETRNLNADTEGKTINNIWTPSLNKAAIEYQQAGSAKLRKEKGLVLAQEAEANARAYGTTLQNQMLEMDVKKRESAFNTEMSAYKEKVRNDLINAGFDNSTIGLILNSIDRTISALHGNMTYSHGKNESNNRNKSDVNINSNNKSQIHTTNPVSAKEISIINTNAGW